MVVQGIRGTKTTPVCVVLVELMIQLLGWRGCIFCMPSLIITLISVMLLQSITPSFFASSFLHCYPSQQQVNVFPAKKSYTTTGIGQSNDDTTNDHDENYDDDDDDDDEPTIKPYRNRSLAWTIRYRTLNPYEKARARVINNFGHRSKADWDEAVSNGYIGQYVPNYPDEMYAPEWVSWDEWLGLMRPYNDTKNLATNILGLKSLDEYLIFVKSSKYIQHPLFFSWFISKCKNLHSLILLDSKRAEGLRIPVRPDIFYKDEWIDEDSFFGSRGEV